MGYRIVVDTNVIISSVLTPGGKPDQLFMAVFEGQLQLILSQAILQEARRVFSYHKIQKLLDRKGVTTEDIEDFLFILSVFCIEFPQYIKKFRGIKSFPLPKRHEFNSCYFQVTSHPLILSTDTGS